MNRIIIVLIFTVGLTTTGLQSQELTQTIKGRVLDSESGVSLPGATVIIPGTEPLIGTVTNIDGYYRIENVLVGRYDLQVSFIGYESFFIRELIVGSAKEVILNIGLKESVAEMEVVEIRASQDKDKALNPMAIISARQLSVEEARRYAGGVDDLAQLATSFAGVAGNLSSNAIAVRGNASKGLLWQMEGVQISNPSHYANVTSFGGGAFTALSAQLLANSDFYTGA
nr:carboxypeptidase-like regulatory domain-containing protein [Bacteroidota bacterium]